MQAGEFLQAGIESFGRADKAAADAEMLALGLDATAHYGLARPDIRMGDVALFAALVAALDLAPAWKRRLIKDFNHKSSLAHDLDRLTIGASHARPEYQGVLAALAGSDPKAAHALVTDLLSIAGITAVGGRSVGEIADRFLEQSALGAQTSLPQDTRGLIEKFLAISGDPDAAAAELRAFARDANVALDAALDLFESRTGFLAARGVDVARIPSPPPSAAASTITPASCSSCTTRTPARAGNSSPADAMTACSRGSARARRSRRSASRSGSSDWPR